MLDGFRSVYVGAIFAKNIAGAIIQSFEDLGGIEEDQAITSDKES